MKNIILFLFLISTVIYAQPRQTISVTDTTHYVGFDKVTGLQDSLNAVQDTGYIDQSVKTTASPSFYGTTINQGADDVGFQINGYDDKSTSYYGLDLSANGYAMINLTDRLYFQLLGISRMIFFPNSLRLYDNFSLGFGTDGDFQWIYDEEGSFGLELNDADGNTFLTITDRGSDAEFNFNGEIISDGTNNGQSRSPIVGDPDNLLASLVLYSDNLYDGIFIANAPGTAQLPELASGMNFEIGVFGDYEVTVTPDASNNFILDGVQLSDGVAVTNLSSAGDYMKLRYYDSNTWWARSNGWTAASFESLMADTATTKLWAETDSVGITTGNSAGGDEVQIMYNKNRTALGANEYTSDFSVDEDGWGSLGGGDETSSISASASALQVTVTSAGTNDERPALYHADDILTDGEWYVVKMPYTLNSGTCKLEGINFFNYFDTTYGAGELASSGVMTFVGQADTSVDNYFVYFDGTSEFDLTISEITIDSLPSYHLANNNLAESPRLTSDSLDFDGIDQSIFNIADTWDTFNELSVYMVVLQKTWTTGDILFDGLGASDFKIKQYNATPTVSVYYGANTDGTDKLPLDTWGVLTAIGDNTSATVQINDSTASTSGDAGTIDARGFTLGGGDSGGATTSDVAVKALIVRKGTDNTATQDIIKDYLYNKYSLPASPPENPDTSTQVYSTQPIGLWNGAYASGDDYILPSAAATMNHRFYPISPGDTVTVVATVTHAGSLLWTDLKLYQYDGIWGNATAANAQQHSLWGANEDSSKIYWTIVAEDDANVVTLEITKSSLSPDTSGIITLHDWGVYTGITDQIPNTGVPKSFSSSGNMSVTSDGLFLDGTDSVFIWAVYAGNPLNEYSTYASQGINTIIGGYPNSTTLDSARGAGMYYMPNIAVFMIYDDGENPLYADTANFRSRLQAIKATDSRTDSLVLYWDNEQYSEYQNAINILAIANEEMPEVPIITNLGNPGMARMFRDDLDAIMTYGDLENTVPVFKIIDNMDSDSLNAPGSMAVASILYDAYSATEFETLVLRAVAAGAKGIAMHKDGTASDIAPEPGEETDITQFRLWAPLPTLIDSVNTLLGL